MISIKVFVFNPFQENTYLVFDETKECMIIDAGCYTSQEQLQLQLFIEAEKLTPLAHIITHTHIDHLLGNNFIFLKYNLKPIIHRAGIVFLQTAPEHAGMFGLKAGEVVEPERFINDGDIISFGKSTLEVRYTPGHADGSVCLVNHENKFVLTGDVLFNGSIGRTDLPSGDFELLASSIQSKLYSLPNEFIVYPGHGPHTTIGAEKRKNPFVREGQITFL